MPEFGLTHHAGVVGTAGDGDRVDRYIAETLRLVPRSQIPLRVAAIRVDGKAVKRSHRLRTGQTIEVDLLPKPPVSLSPEPIELDIIYEDEQVLVLNKPAGMVVHPGHGNRSRTLVQALLHHIKELDRAFAESESASRPGIVHRLDKDTSGVMIVAKNPSALEFLAQQFRTRRVRKVYIAVVYGRPPAEQGVIRGAIRRDPHNRKRFSYSERVGKPAETAFHARRYGRGWTALRLTPKTGRTHQLRVHMSHIGTPILGDPIYSRPHPELPVEGLMLHAYTLKIVLPGETEPRRFRAPIPERFRPFISDVTDSDQSPE